MMLLEYNPNGRQEGPADWYRRYRDPRFKSDWKKWMTQIAHVFGWDRFTALHLADLGIFGSITNNAPDIEGAILRGVTGVPIEGWMIVATEHPREYRLFRAANKRPSSMLDLWVEASDGRLISWPAILAQRDNLLPDHMADLEATELRAAFRTWAQVDECRCGSNALHLVDSPDWTGYFNVERRYCREQDATERYFVGLVSEQFGFGKSFTSADLVAADVDTTVLSTAVVRDSPVSVGMRLAALADQIPPGDDKPFIVRLGKANNSRTAAFAVTAWNLFELLYRADDEWWQPGSF